MGGVETIDGFQATAARAAADFDAVVSYRYFTPCT